MKQKIILILIPILFLLASINIQAAHILGGEITYVKTGPSMYQIKLTILRDCAGNGADFDNPAVIGIFKTVSGQTSLVQQLSIPIDTIESIDLMAENTVCLFSNDICVEKGTYIFEQELIDNSGEYTVSYQRCCRSEIISNLITPGGIGMTFSTTINSNINNSSPVFTSDIPLANFVNVSFVYDGSATDIDGDSLVYELSTPLLGGGLGGTPGMSGDPSACDGVLPNPTCPPPYEAVNFLLPNYSLENMLGGNHPLEIDSNIGEMTATPTIIGVFQIGYNVKEYRDGILIGNTKREFMFVITPSDSPGLQDVGGTVWMDSLNTLDLGKVELFEHDLEGDSLIYISEVSVDVNGTYNFPTIPHGVHYLKASPSPGSNFYATHLPTYYRDDLIWYEANAISECDTSSFFRDIYLTSLQDSTEGFYDLGGFILAEANGPSIDGINLLLLDDNQNFIRHAMTNSSGYFVFKNLADGEYQIYVDLVNSDIDNTIPPTINLTGSADYNFTIYDTYLDLDGLIPTENINPLSPIRFFPNPVKQRLFVDGLVSFERLEITILNNVGQVLIQNSSITNHGIDVSFLPKGLYLVKVSSGDESMVKKIILR